MSRGHETRARGASPQLHTSTTSALVGDVTTPTCCNTVHYPACGLFGFCIAISASPRGSSPVTPSALASAHKTRQLSVAASLFITCCNLWPSQPEASARHPPAVATARFPSQPTPDLLLLSRLHLIGRIIHRIAHRRISLAVMSSHRHVLSSCHLTVMPSHHVIAPSCHLMLPRLASPSRPDASVRHLTRPRPSAHSVPCPLHVGRTSVAGRCSCLRAQAHHSLTQCPLGRCAARA